jgi:hypothetical protein
MQHGLTLNDIDHRNTMNYQAIDKVIDDKVINLLRNEPRTDGTCEFLLLMKSIKTAFMEQSTTVADRLFEATWCIHFLRLWKQHMLKTEVSLNNFISKNVHDCLEINYVFMIKMIVENKCENIFLMNSQIVEDLFRKVRSQCGVDSMIVNSSIFGIMGRMQKVQMEQKLIHDLSSIIQFHESTHATRSNSKQPISEFMIDEIIKAATKFAELKAFRLGIAVEPIEMNLLFSSINDNAHSQLVFEDDILLETEENEDFLEVDDESLDINFMSEPDSTEQYQFQNLSFRSDEQSNSLSIPALYNGREISVTKKKICYLLQTNKVRMHNDLEKRFINKREVSIKKPSERNSYHLETEIARGDYIVINDHNLYMGRIVNMRFCEEKTKKNRRFNSDFISLNDSNISKLNVLLDPVFSISNSFFACEIFEKKYFNASLYVCHAPTNKRYLDEQDVANLKHILKEN